MPQALHRAGPGALIHQQFQLILLCERLQAFTDSLNAEIAFPERLALCLAQQPFQHAHAIQLEPALILTHAGTLTAGNHQQADL